MKNENESKLVKYGKKTASGIGKITAITPTIELTKAVKDKAVDDTIEAYSFISRIIKPKKRKILNIGIIHAISHLKAVLLFLNTHVYFLMFIY